MEFGKKPDHWPYVPKKQQIEAFESVARRMEHLFVLRNAVNRVCKEGWIGSTPQYIRQRIIDEEEDRRYGQSKQVKSKRRKKES